MGQEAMSMLIDHEMQLKNISKIKSNINGPCITHVMCVDDIIIFSKASKKDASNLMKLGLCCCIYTMLCNVDDQQIEA